MKYECENCGKSLSRSGYYKHRKTCGVEKATVQEPPSEEPVVQDSSVEEPVVQETTHGWQTFTLEEENVTEHLPTPLKFLPSAQKVKKKKKMTAKELKTLKDTNIALLKMGLSGSDRLTTYYGRAVTLDESYVCSHSEATKDMVAEAQYAWMVEKGLDLSQHISKGLIASTLTAGYIIPPVLKVQKKSKVPFLKKISTKGSFTKRIINRLMFWRKPTAIRVTEADILDE